MAWWASCLGVLLACDVAATVLCILSIHHWSTNSHPLSWSSLTDFKHDATDLFLLVCSRAVLLPAIACTVHVVQRPMKLPTVRPGHNKDLLTPLNDLGEVRVVKRSGRPLLLCAALLLCTAWQAFAGVKCLVFDYSENAVQGSLMGLSVLWIGLEILTLLKLATPTNGGSPIFCDRRPMLCTIIATLCAANVATVSPLVTNSKIFAHYEVNRSICDLAVLALVRFSLTGLLRTDLCIYCIGMFIYVYTCLCMSV